MRQRCRQLRWIDREICPGRVVGSIAPGVDGASATNSTLVAHFAYGALSGAALAAIQPKPSVTKGIIGGVSIWLGSYLGWIPALGILKPASRHPGDRNRLMILAHVVWGSAYAVTQRELMKSGKAFGDGPLKDRAH